MEASADKLQFGEPTSFAGAEHFQKNVSAQANTKFDFFFAFNFADLPIK